MNIPEKILARAADRDIVTPGDFVTVKIDRAVITDMGFAADGGPKLLKVDDPSKLVMVFDHLVPAKDGQTAEAHAMGKELVRRLGITRVHDYGLDQGICHQVVAEQGYAIPGTVLVCGDSHTCSAGAFNCAARGIGGADMTYASAKGETWFRVGPTVRYDLTGSLPFGVAAKDIFLTIAGRWGEHVNMNLEYGGPALANLSMTQRRTLATMAAELSAEFAIFEPDDTLLSYMKARTTRTFDPVWPDKDAIYLDRRTLDLSALEPLVARPDAVVKNAFPVAETAGTRIDQAFIGSCANGTLEDLEMAAKVVSGRRVDPNVRLIVTPASSRIFAEAAKLGYIATLAEAGATITNSTCGACAGLHSGVLAAGETCITSSTRNYKGRMGSDQAKIYMGSSATVAASALKGAIADPREFLS
jgi:3-isopropylmalate/(R)-2-methylmalate dehydratase large subunit